MNLTQAEIAIGVLLKLRRFRRQEHWTREELDAYQVKALHQLREYVYAHSRFYQQFHRGLTDHPLHDLPVLTKSMLMEHYDDLVTDPAIHLDAVRKYLAQAQPDDRFLGRYWINTTSGSSGTPGVFLFNQTEWTTVLASFARAQEWAGLGINPFHRTKMAVVASTSPWHMSSQVGATLRSSWMPTLRLSASEPLTVIVQRLNEWQPKVLVGYASMISILADEQIAGRLNIAPSLIFTSSEVLTREARSRIEATWGQIVFNEYGTTESGSLGMECKQHIGQHLFEDLVIVEVVDRDNQPVQPGRYGDKLLITVLFNRSQPLIRYELTDSVKMATVACPSGHSLALIEDIQGRTEDILLLPSTMGNPITIHPIVFHNVMDMLSIDGWQIVQEDQGLNILIRSSQPNLTDNALIVALHEALAAQGAAPMPIQIKHVTTIPQSTSGKTPLIKANSKRTEQHRV